MTIRRLIVAIGAILALLATPATASAEADRPTPLKATLRSLHGYGTVCGLKAQDPSHGPASGEAHRVQARVLIGHIDAGVVDGTRARGVEVGDTLGVVGELELDLRAGKGPIAVGDVLDFASGALGLDLDVAGTMRFGLENWTDGGRAWSAAGRVSPSPVQGLGRDDVVVEGGSFSGIVGFFDESQAPLVGRVGAARCGRAVPATAGFELEGRFQVERLDDAGTTLVGQGPLDGVDDFLRVMPGDNVQIDATRWRARVTLSQDGTGEGAVQFVDAGGARYEGVLRVAESEWAPEAADPQSGRLSASGTLRYRVVAEVDEPVRTAG
jgi:hypothetical protein